MALGNRNVNRRIFEKAGSNRNRMSDDKITQISQSFASNVHIDAPETPDAAQAMIYAIQGIEEDVQELHRHISSDDLAVNITGNAATATALTAGNKTLDGNFTIDTGHSLTVPFLNTYQINPPSGTDTDLTISSNGNIKFTLDNNTNETGQSFTFRNHTGMGNYTDMLTLDESGHFTLYGAAAGDPHIKLHQNTNTSTSGPPILEFFRNAAYTDNSELGLISFKGKTDSNSVATYAEISGISEETSGGIRGGKIEFKIASHDGEMVTGLKIEDGVSEDDVDITIGTNTATTTLMHGMTSIGTSGTGGSFRLFTDDSSKYAQWSNQTHDLNFADNTALSFGTKQGFGKGDVNFAFNGTELHLAPSFTNYNNIFKLTKPGTGITRLDVEGSITGSTIKATSLMVAPTAHITSLYALATADFSSNVVIDGNIELGHASDTTIARSAAGEVTIEGKKIVTENYVKHVLNCGWVGSTNARQYLPFGAGGVTYTTDPRTWSEMGAFIAPADGAVDHIIIRCSGVAGLSNVGVHIASNGTEMPTFNQGTFTTRNVNMSVDDTSYKFENFTNAGGTHNSFSAGDIIVVSFDPQGYPADAIATMVLNLDWTNTL